MNSVSYERAMSAMATLLNYMNVSTYEGQMTLQHKEFRHNIDQFMNNVAIQKT